jgi:hypothetical protein
MPNLAQHSGALNSLILAPPYILMASTPHEGYAQIAWRMSAYPDLAIVRRFQELNVQNVLYLQAELCDLEEQLRKQEETDSASQSQTQRWNARSWRSLQKGSALPGGDDSKWQLVLLVREKLKEYSK